MKKILLCIMDGVGYRSEEYGNAVKAAKTPNLDMLKSIYPHSLLDASGEMVGLPSGQMGNSEVGHMNIGAGRIVYQPLMRITNDIKSGKFFENENINEVIDHVIKNNSRLHLMGLLSGGGVHSHIDHLFALLDLCKKKNLKDVYVHVFTDGRDTPIKSGRDYIIKLQNKLKEIGFGKIASISGRYYVMDRDNNYDRVRKAYDVIANGLGHVYENILDYVDYEYENNVTDEFIKPAIIDRNGILKSNDGIIVYNYRPDRLREICTAITNNDFDAFPRKNLKNIKMITMMLVSDSVKCKRAYELETLNNTLGEYIEKNNLTQLRIAETEKYAHVTYFFDGGLEKEYAHDKRILIPSPKVATYDLMPEMSAYKITDKLLEELDNFDLIILNYANGDMVGHTGVFDKTVKAVEVVDECVGKLYEKCKEKDITMVISADHGNAEVMLDENGNVVTSHTTSKVPLIITDKNYKVKDGKISDIAPTILNIMGLEVPKEMTSDVLVERI